MFNCDKQYADNLRHATHPEPGDYWHEMFCPVLVVLKVTNESVTYCEKRKSARPDHWTWDLSETKRVWREDFRKRLEYQSAQMKDKFWAWVAPRCHIEFADHWRDESKTESGE